MRKKIKVNKRIEEIHELSEKKICKKCNKKIEDKMDKIIYNVVGLCFSCHNRLSVKIPKFKNK